MGAIYSLTGSYATIEDPALKGAKLAVKQVNAAGGVKGHQIELIHYDGKSTAGRYRQRRPAPGA